MYGSLVLNSFKPVAYLQSYWIMIPLQYAIKLRRNYAIYGLLKSRIHYFAINLSLYFFQRMA
jgi:hypothetical protein